MADTFIHTIQQNAEGPNRASGDSGSVQQHSISEQLKLRNALAADAAVATDQRGWNISRFKPPGAIPDK